MLIKKRGSNEQKMDGIMKKNEIDMKTIKFRLKL